MVDEVVTNPEDEDVEQEEFVELTEEEKWALMRERLKEAEVPEEVIDAIPKWKNKYKIRVAFLGDGAYIYRKLTWGELKEITNTLGNLSRGGATNEAVLNMADLEFQLEKAVMYPRMTVETCKNFPSGDLETLQALVNEFSGYARIMPVVEDL